jgi:hypothetical protein
VAVPGTEAYILWKRPSSFFGCSAAPVSLSAACVDACVAVAHTSQGCIELTASAVNK